MVSGGFLHTGKIIAFWYTGEILRFVLKGVMKIVSAQNSKQKYRKGMKDMGHYIEDNMIIRFEKMLTEDEKSISTRKKYIRDVKVFSDFMEGQVTKEAVIDYKQNLIEQYAVSTVNAMLASVNSFLKSMGWYECTVKSLKIQKEAFRPEERELTKEEYYKLLSVAKENGNNRLYYLMQTICATGIRVSELSFITVESLYIGQAIVSLKGKTRTVLLPKALCRNLRQYCKEKNIQKGSIFVTRNGMPVNRSNIFREMKALCETAGVNSKKVFPHNLRHLFACVYYQEEKDISHLADMLGHSSINTTRIYLAKSSEEQARQIEKLGLVV